MASSVLAWLALGAAATHPPRAADAVSAPADAGYRDGHARPRALAFNPDDGLLYVALSTADEIAVVAPSSPPRLLARSSACRFPDALVALPGGGALVSCRFDAGLRRIARDAAGAFRVDVVAAAGGQSGARGLAIAPDGAHAYLASPAIRGIVVVSLPGGGVVQARPTGISPRALRLIPAGRLPGQSAPLLLVSNFIDHTVTVHPLAADGRVGDPIQTIHTDAPVLDLAVVGGLRPALLLLTHEDRPVSRAHGPVEGLDSGLLRLPARPTAVLGTPPFEDPGAGRRAFVNLGERRDPVIELAAAAVSARAPASGGLAGGATLAIVGAGSDNLLLTAADDPTLASATVVAVGANPTAVAALPGRRFVTADRLSDTLTFVDSGRVTATLVVGAPERPSPAERGELLFYSRALVPNNVADGPLSLYTCAACHDDGHLDGRRHPAKQNRFFSTTLTCRGLATTAPYLRLGNQATLDVFADNIVATHAQGAERDPARFDRYPVTLRLRARDGWTTATVSPDEVRAALARYLERIPREPSPFVAPGARQLDRQARRGLSLFRDSCAGCHQLVRDAALGDRVPEAALEARLLAGQVALTSPGRYPVGTPVLGEGGNNPPSLRGVWDAAPYFSDGSARTLEEVLRRTDPGAPEVHAPANAARPPAFSAAERAALLALLRAL